MDVASLSGIEELVLGLGLAVTSFLALGVLRRLLTYALTAGTFVTGLLIAAALFVYRPSHVYGWVEQQATTRWSQVPTSEQLVDRGLVALEWAESRLRAAKGQVDQRLEPRPHADEPNLERTAPARTASMPRRSDGDDL